MREVIGATLGPYIVLDRISSGGMGEVYLADDPRLGRKVAIKILPPAFAEDGDRRRRFEQEARAAAALNHPHIAAVHDIGSEPSADGSGDIHYIVQEHLEGRTLRETLASAGFPQRFVAEAVPDELPRFVFVQRVIATCGTYWHLFRWVSAR